MKHKKLFVFFLSFILIFIVYKAFENDKTYYLSLGDNFAVGATPFDTVNKSYADYFKEYLSNKHMLKEYNNVFSELNYRTTDIIKDIRLNKVKTLNNKKISINESIAKSNVITISIGFNDLFYKTKYNKKEFKFDKNMRNYIEELFNDINELINLIRKINDSPIYFIGYYNPHNTDDGITDKMINYIEQKFKNINQIKVYYVDIKEGVEKVSYYLPNIYNPMPSLEGYNYISNELIKMYEKNK